MIPGYHDHEKFAQAHRHDLLREAEHERLLAQLPRPDHRFLRYLLARAGLFIRELRKRRQQLGKRRKQQVTNRVAQ
jgi:hypothetical protein